MPVDGVERMKNNSEITHYAIQNKQVDLIRTLRRPFLP